jgi:predicted aspartyl protease
MEASPLEEQQMGLTFVEGVVTGKKGKKTCVHLLVDSGAVYTLLPEKDWKTIGLKPKRSMTFRLADGTKTTRNVSECHIRLPQGEGHTPVILGEPGDEGLLGAVTLEILGLVLNPFKRTLQTMHAMLARVTGFPTIRTGCATVSAFLPVRSDPRRLRK